MFVCVYVLYNMLFFYYSKKKAHPISNPSFSLFDPLQEKFDSFVPFHNKISPFFLSLDLLSSIFTFWQWINMEGFFFLSFAHFVVGIFIFVCRFFNPKIYTTVVVFFGAFSLMFYFFSFILTIKYDIEPFVAVGAAVVIVDCCCLYKSNVISYI